MTNKKDTIGDKKEELEKIIEKSEKDEQKLLKQSDKARKGIEELLLKSYDRIRNRYKNGLAVVQVSHESCGGCFNKVPAQIQIDMQQNIDIIACEHCGRILVDEEAITNK